MDIIMAILEMTIKKLKRLILIVIIVAGFVFPKSYEKAGDRVVSKTINFISKDSNEDQEIKIVSQVAPKSLDNMIKSIRGKK